MSFRIFLILLIILGSSFFVNADNPTSLDFTFNNLTIYGKSNVNNFSFVLKNESDTLLKENIITERNQSETKFLFPVTSFKTVNKCIQNDFLQMIKADSFPYIKLSVENVQMEKIALGVNCESINAVITIAEESRHYRIPITKGGKQTKEQYIIGNIELLLTDFNLVPLSKFLGLVKVQNNVVIDFRINLIPS